ncbi:cation:proton antiporter [Enterovirga aerilata]|uniref:Potassium transporter TrkA n=1 Tax=Enterovirga aerilata TaxID=2730920 RepID=A0A849I6T4_9HYPH|nr:cation:proton antiporter [Enterovirga sp. DB1703]NNM72119.1 potassium transporter TrkA [Enterovirga sp. DB1703]
MAAPAADIASYKEVILFLATAGIVVPLATRLRISPVLGFIGAGALLGPYGLGRFAPELPWLTWVTIPNRGEVSHLAELGVVFLLFTIGIELSWDRLRVLRRLVFGLGAAQVATCALAIGGIGMLLGITPVAAVLSGLALALSSTAIVVPVLAAQKRLGSPTGRATFAVLLFQDLAVAPILFTIAALGAPDDGGLAWNLVLALGQAAVALAVIVVLGRLAMRPLFHMVAQTRSSELFLAASFLMVIVAALLAAASGMSMALGAFVAGLLLAETEYRRAIEAVVDPFKGLLLGVFFLSVGMGLDVTALLDAPVTIVLAAGGLLLVKAVLTWGLARLFRLPGRVGVEMALLLAPGGEFAFVLVGAALGVQLLPQEVAQPLLLITTVTMILIPPLARVARPLSRRIAPETPAVNLPNPPAEPGRVVIAGFGRVGQLIADMLKRHGVPYLAIDSNPALVFAQREAGQPVYYGDTSSPLFLRTCGLDTARALVVTLDVPSASQAVVETVRAWRPDLTIVARARDARHAAELYRLGVTDAVPETIEASLQLSEALLVDIGIAMGPVIASIHERRDEFRRALRGEPAGEAAPPEGAPRRAGEFRARRSAGKR